MGVRNKWIKRFLLLLLLILIVSASIVFYILKKSHTDTAEVESKYEIPSLRLIAEFQHDLTRANQKYSEQIITVNGRVSEMEKSDSLSNIKMIDTSNGSYIIFNFQKDQLKKIQSVKPGDSVSIKGSCSNGNFSRILDAYSITFKRCIIHSNFNNQ